MQRSLIFGVTDSFFKTAKTDEFKEAEQRAKEILAQINQKEIKNIEEE